MPALASASDTSRASDNRPVLAHRGLPTCKQEAFASTENVLPVHGVLVQNPTVQLESYRGGELSLSGEPECLSLQEQVCYLQERMSSQSALQVGLVRKGAAFLPVSEPRGLLPKYVDRFRFSVEYIH